MSKYPKTINSLIFQFKCEAHERELQRELSKLDQHFTAWDNGEIESGELSIRVHEYDTGPSRELFKKYNSSYQDMIASYLKMSELKVVPLPGRGADIDPDVLYYNLKPAWMEEAEVV